MHLTDELPAELEFMTASDEASDAEPGTVSWPPFDLAAGEEREMTITARVRPEVEDGTEVRNVAVAPHPDDPNPRDNTDDDLDDVDRPPPRVEQPTPVADPPAWLPRTGLEIASWTAIGIGLLALGLAVRWWAKARPT